jgi:hypothetical protein
MSGDRGIDIRWGQPEALLCSAVNDTSVLLSKENSFQNMGARYELLMLVV